MKAVVATAYGGPEVLKIIEKAKPVPGKGQILIKLAAASVSVADVRSRAFNVPKSFRIPARLALGIFKLRNPVLGGEFAGIIEAVGSNVKEYKPGDRVCASQMPKAGGYAEYVCVDAHKVVGKLPVTVSMTEGAAIPIGGRTAMHFLRCAGLSDFQTRGSKKTVLIYGASGSVGTYAVQLAVLSGAHVTAVCSSKNKELVSSLGAHSVIAYDTEDVSKIDKTYDIVLKAVEPGNFDLLLSLVKQGGQYADVTSPFKSKAMKRAEKDRNVTCHCGHGPVTEPGDLKLLIQLIEQGNIKVVIDTIFRVNEIQNAHRYVESGRKRGNVVVSLDFWN